MADPFVEEQDPNVATMLPVVDEPIDAAVALSAVESVFMQTPDATTFVASAPEVPPVGRSWAFNFAEGHFYVGLNGSSPVQTNDLETLRHWVEKCLNTDRGAHPIHPDNYGFENPFRLVGIPVSGAIDVEDALRQALTFHPRISDVTDVEVDFDPDDDFLDVAFTLVLDNDTAFPIDTVRVSSDG